MWNLKIKNLIIYQGLETNKKTRSKTLDKKKTRWHNRPVISRVCYFSVLYNKVQLYMFVVEYYTEYFLEI